MNFCLLREQRCISVAEKRGLQRRIAEKITHTFAYSSIKHNLATHYNYTIKCQNVMICIMLRAARKSR